jgi:hypothetical protein
MTGGDAALAAAAAAARTMLGASVDAIDRVQGRGRNSRVYRVRLKDKTFAIKQYPSPGADRRDRLETEIDALHLMQRNGIAVVPRALASLPERGFALLSWIEGGAVDNPDAIDIDAAVDFAAAIHHLRDTDEANQQPLAAEACLSGAEIVSQLGRRLARLGAAAAGEPMLAALLDRFNRLLFGTILPASTGRYAAFGEQSFVLPLPRSARTLCPSDFGFHNTLRTSSGLVFLDFEYFGWDDPVKLTSDFLLHPAMNLSDPLKRRFVAAISRVYAHDSAFARRLTALYPLFAMRWCLILLNEFLPERWMARQHAGVGIEWVEAKARQLGLADALLGAVEANEGGFPDVW